MENKKLLKEELNKFNRILEYTFYIGEEGDSPEGENADDLILGGEGGLVEQGEEVTDVALPDEVPVDDPFAVDATVDEPPAPGVDPFAVDATVDEPPAPGVDPFGGETVEDEFAEEPAGEQIEVDVTDIVAKSEEAKEETSQVSSKVDDLLGKFDELESKLGDMDNIITKMDELETEIIQRNPTPNEQLHMRSLDSFPYTVKLTDFWNDKEGYDATEEKKPEEYSLTQDDVDYDYSETDIKDSFRVDK